MSGSSPPVPPPKRKNHKAIARFSASGSSSARSVDSTSSNHPVVGAGHNAARAVKNPHPAEDEQSHVSHVSSGRSISHTPSGRSIGEATEHRHSNQSIPHSSAHPSKSSSNESIHHIGANGRYDEQPELDVPEDDAAPHAVIKGSTLPRAAPFILSPGRSFKASSKVLAEGGVAVQKSASQGILSKEPDAVIGVGVHVTGDFEYDKLLRIDGRFEGQLITQNGGDLIVGKSGVVVGDIINAHRIVIDGGTVSGDIHDAHEVVIRDGSTIRGDVKCRHIKIDGERVRWAGSVVVDPDLQQHACDGRRGSHSPPKVSASLSFQSCR